mmetsp:Transcript_23538/g.72284  ORF Transcript_23538/g.72284 Transcript_23538/m.72284 type:complete len:233 (-) Transcript_23538:342-1040(-)
MSGTLVSTSFAYSAPISDAASLAQAKSQSFRNCSAKGRGRSSMDAHAMEWSAYVLAQRCIKPRHRPTTDGSPEGFPAKRGRQTHRLPYNAATTFDSRLTGTKPPTSKSSGRNPCNRFQALAELSAYLPSSPQSLIVCMSIFFVAMCSQAPSDVPSSLKTRRHASTTDASLGTANNSRTRWARSCTFFSCLSLSSSRVVRVNMRGTYSMSAVFVFGVPKNSGDDENRTQSVRS